jgi:membrane protease YdiL (CAAX protease family)
MEPIKPVTPPDSLFWRIVHFPPVLLVIGIAMMIAAEIAASLVSQAIPHAGNGWLAVLAAIASASAVVIIYWILARFVERRRGFAEFGRAGWARELGGGALGGLALFSVVVGIIAALGGYRIIGTHPASVLLPALAISIFSGVTEEIVMRGAFFRLIESFLGSWIALILSAALFGALHLGNDNATLLAGSAIMLEAGVMLAALYMLTRRLWAAIGLHAAWNFAQGGIYGIPVSGFRLDGILVPRMVGPDLVTGGAFGAEASLPAILICTIFGVVVTTVAWRRGRFVKPFWARISNSAPTGSVPSR